MTDQERTELEWRLATRLGDDAWELNQYGGFHEPKPLARSLDVLMPLVEAWCRERGFGWILQQFYDPADRIQATIYAGLERDWRSIADTPAEALALAVDAALAQEGGAAQ